MSKTPGPPYEITHHVRDRCLCLKTQQAARVLARHFDQVFAPLGLTNGQFSLLMSLNRPTPPTMGSVAELLAMDRTTLTAALKPLERRALIEVKDDQRDRRRRRVSLTWSGRVLLRKAAKVWSSTHEALDEMLGMTAERDLQSDLGKLLRLPLLS
jgi:DNA-binding MarR family transcriptional regulator